MSDDARAPRRDDDRPWTNWSIDRRIPLSLIIVLLAQIVAVVHWGGRVQDTVDDQGRRIALLEQANVDRDRIASQHWDEVIQRLTHLETLVRMIGPHHDQ